MNIVYKKADENDAYGIAYVSAYSWKETYKEILPDDYLKDRIEKIPIKIEQTKLFLRDYVGNYVVAKDNNNVIGILAYRSNDDDIKYKEYGCLDALYVLNDYHGFGIGKELFRQAVVGLKNMGYNKMKLECMSVNPTVKFYEKYLGIISDTIDYLVNDEISVKVDVILFENLDNVIEKLSKIKS